MLELETTDVRSSNNSPIAMIFLGTFCLALGWLSSFAWIQRDTIADLWLRSNEQKYLTMTGEAGPVTYAVTHRDYKALKEFALIHEDVMGVEVYKLPDKAAIAFTAAQSESIEIIKNSSVVLAMHQEFIPMMCH